jgi:hypothetical protein
VVGHPAAPRLRHRRTADLRRRGHAAGSERVGGAGSVPRPLDRPTAGRGRLPLGAAGMDGAPEQVARRPPRSSGVGHRRRDRPPDAAPRGRGRGGGRPGGGGRRAGLRRRTGRPGRDRRARPELCPPAQRHRRRRPARRRR